MNQQQAEQFITLLTGAFSFERAGAILKLPSYFKAAGAAAGRFSEDFEFSWIKGAPKVRLLHLRFWRTGLKPRVIAGILRGREAQIAAAAERAAAGSGGVYDLALLGRFFNFNRAAGSWPLQFGAEFGLRGQPRLKVYLSVRGRRFPLAGFCRLTGLDHGLLGPLLKKEKMDSVGLDLLPGGGHAVKFYPERKNISGLLYRIGEGSKVGSVKSWKNFPGGLPVASLDGGGFMVLPEKIKAFLELNKCRISYVCAEKGRKSVYFR